MENIIISSENLSRHFKVGTVTINALNAVSFAVNKNEFVALMGASGSGKSTLMNLIGCLDSATSGSYNLNGTNVKEMDENSLANIRNKEIGFIFQTFNLLPRYTALENVILPLIYAGIKKEEREIMAKKALENVGLSDRMTHKPNELSGGQRQRVGIARALMLNPEFIVADEPVSMIDASSRLSILGLLRDLQQSKNISFLYITHDIATARQFSDRIAVMFFGRIVELCKSNRLVKNPLHPYTKSLIEAIPSANPNNLHRLRKVIPRSNFHQQCTVYDDKKGKVLDLHIAKISHRCRKTFPKLQEIQPNHYVACHLKT